MSITNTVLQIELRIAHNETGLKTVRCVSNITLLVNLQSPVLLNAYGPVNAVCTLQYPDRINIKQLKP